MADASVKANLPHPHRLRSAAEHIQLSWVEGTAALEPLIGKTRRHSLMQVFQGVLNAVGEKTLTTDITVPELARRCYLKPRTVGRKMRALEHLGWIKRTNRGPAPWETVVEHGRVLELGGAHKIRAKTERVREANRRAPASPPPEPPPAPASTQAAAKPTKRSTTPKKKRGTSAVLASLLWNATPWRADGSRDANAATSWPAEILDLEPSELAQLMDLYCAACYLGTEKWCNKQVSVADFQKRIWDVRQWDKAPANTTHPSLGRELRPEWERKKFESGEYVWRTPAGPQRGPDHERAQLLEPWLRPFYGLRGFSDKLAELLAQEETGPPPDWLPEELRPRWGQLRIFTVAH